MNFGVAEYCQQLNADAAHPERVLISEDDVKNLHANGIAVNPWTVNSEEDIIKFTKWGCDALITDVPDFCKKVFQALFCRCHELYGSRFVFVSYCRSYNFPACKNPAAEMAPSGNYTYRSFRSEDSGLLWRH